MKVLLIDDNPCDRARVVQTLCQAWPAVEYVEVSQRQEFEAAMAHTACDSVLIATGLRWTESLTVLRTVRARWPHTPVVLLTETGHAALAAEGMRSGLSDYVLKSALQRLPVVLQDSLEKARLQARRQRLEEELHLRVRQQAAVAELGQRALAGMPMSPLFDAAVALVAQTLDVEYATVLELLPEGEALRLRAGVGWHAGLVGVALVGAGVTSQAGYTLLSDTPVVVHDLRTETRFSGLALLHDHGVISGMSVLIRGTPRPFGVLGAHTTRHRLFSADDLHFLQAMANVLGQAIARQRTEVLLRQSEAKLATIFRTSPNAITLTRLSDGVCLAVNDRFSVVTGYTPAEALGISTLELNLWVDPHDRHRLRQELHSHGEALHQQVLFRTKHGAVLPTLLSARVVDIDSTPCILAISQDISALKHAEAERAAEARFLHVQLEVARVALSGLQADVLLPQVLAVICRAQDYPVGLLWRLVENGRVLEIVASYGEGTTPFVGYRREVHDPLPPAAQAIRTGAPVFLNQVTASSHAIHPLARTLQLQAIMALPLMARTGESLGVLSLGDSKNPARFTVRDLEQGIHLRRDTRCHNGFRPLKSWPPVTGMPGVFESRQSYANCPALSGYPSPPRGRARAPG